MAAGITFSIGGKIDRTYKTALQQSVIEARAANSAIQKDMAISSGIAVDMSTLGQFKQWRKEYLASLAEEARLQEALRTGGTRRTPLSSDPEYDAALIRQNGLIKVRVAEIAAKKAADIENDIEVKATYEKLKLAQKVAKEKSLYNAIALGEIAKQDAEALAIQKAEQIAASEAIVAGAAHGGSGGHGPAGMTGIIRESLVIIREISMGRGLGRVAGSVTLLAQYLGLLNKAVYSTATSQVLAARAAEKLNVQMAVQALMAKGTAAETELLEASQKQAVITTAALKDEQIALATATVTLNPIFFAAVAIIALVAATAGVLIYSYHKAAVAAKNLADALNPLKQKYTELAEAQDKAAKAAKENADWITNLNNKHESESSQLERKIKLLKEEQAARRRVAEARGASDAELQALDIANLQQEKAMLEVQQKRIETENASAQAAEQAASKAAIAGTTTTDEKGRVINLDQAQSNAKKRGEILDAAQDALDKGTFYSNEVDHYQQTGAIATPVYKRRQGNDSDIVSFEVGGKSFSMSVGEAKKNFDFMSAQARKLAEDQAALDDVLKNTKSTAQEKMDAQNRVKEDLENVNSELGIATNDPRGRHGGGGRSATERERLGIGAPQVANLQKQTLDVSKQQLSEMQKLNANVSKLIASGNGASNPDGW